MILGLLLLKLFEHAFQHGQVRTTGERFLARRNNNALDLVVARRRVDDGAQFLHRIDGENIHRLFRHVPCDESNAISVGFNFEIYISHCLNLLKAHPEKCKAVFG